MHTILCRERQTLEIGADITVTVLEIAPGGIRLRIEAPGRRVTREELVPLPVGASELRLTHHVDLPHWPRSASAGKK